MVKSVSERIDFVRSHGSHCHFSKRNCMIFFTYYSAYKSYCAYKSIRIELYKINNFRDILFFILAYFDIKYKIFRKLFIFL